MTIIRRILLLAFLSCVYGQLILQKRAFDAAAKAGIPEGNIYHSGEIASNYDSRVARGNVADLGSMRRGLQKSVSRQKPPTSGKIKDYSHNTGIGGYHWALPDPRVSFRKQKKVFNAFHKFQQDIRAKKHHKSTFPPNEHTNEVPSSSQGKQPAGSTPMLGQIKQYRSGRSSLDLTTSAESSGGGLGKMKQFSSGRRSTNFPTSPESSPSDSPEDHFSQALRQLPRVKTVRDQSIASPSRASHHKHQMKGMIDWFKGFKHRLSCKAPSSTDACQPHIR